MFNESITEVQAIKMKFRNPMNSGIYPNSKLCRNPVINVPFMRTFVHSKLYGAFMNTIDKK